MGNNFQGSQVGKPITIRQNFGIGIQDPNNGGSTHLPTLDDFFNQVIALGLIPTPSGGSGWELTGNTGTNPATDFLGTTDAQDLLFKTNDVERIKILSSGYIGIGTSTPNNLFEVFGSTLIGDGLNTIQLTNPGNLTLTSNDGTGNASQLTLDNVTAALSSANSGGAGSNISVLGAGSIQLASTDGVSTTNQYITGAGIGIDVLTPAYKLDILGDLFNTYVVGDVTSIFGNSSYGGSQSIYAGVSDSVTQLSSEAFITESLVKILQQDGVTGASGSLEMNTATGLSMSFNDGVNNFSCNVTPTGIGLGPAAPTPTESLDVNGNIKTDGDVILTDNTKGVILYSPDNTAYRVTVANGGTLTVTAV